jgi:Holliday junction DNA helicase RuvA
VIAFLDGEVVSKGANRVVLDVGGVGYDILVPTPLLGTLPAPGRRARVHTRMVVRDDAMQLFGFATPEDRELFDMLTAVTGVGPKLALSFLSALAPEPLRRAIADGDGAMLTLVPGVGRKVAERVLVELRDRLGGDVDAAPGGPLADVRDALLSLGLTPHEASAALRGVEADGRPADELLREALQAVSGARGGG